ncbi:LCP family protein [Curtobacterium sp. VKM Ac-2922]|uniref:LCP family protein n=1 Tax=Curtobacterium sp. VKM Ac-2922 TaxID=2929475 RepID=UPI001FB3C80D|nr:LCP family protein [Curtobacterium sp. VKM Ac-2922]MCJ1714221.1 LCP family protein [Curtobacterium sp. VKM Ac-2922]
MTDPDGPHRNQTSSARARSGARDGVAAFDDLIDARRRPAVVSGPGYRVSGARHGRGGGQLGLRRLATIVGMTAAVVVVSATSLSAYAAYDVGHGFQQGAVDIGGAGSTDGAFNVLAIGADNDPSQGQAYGDRGATLNDSNVLLHVSADHTQAVAVSFPRDLIVDQPACGDSPAVTNTPLNQAYGRGGMDCVASTIEHVTDMQVPFAAQVSFAGVIRMSDAVGGVPVCVTDAVDDPYTGLQLSAGEHTVSGATALAFLRDRHGVGDGSDLSRISSLQQFLSSLLRKVKSEGTLRDPTELYGLAKAASKNITLSTSLAKPATMVDMARAFDGIGLDHITFVQYPGSVTDPAFPGKVVPDQATAQRLMGAVRADRPFRLDAGATGRGATDATGGGAGGGSATGSSADQKGGASSPERGSGSDVGPSPSATTQQMSGVTGQTARQKTCAVAAG